VADFRLVDPIGHEAAGFDEPLKWVDHPQPVLLRQLHDQLSVRVVFGFIIYRDPIGTTLRNGGKYTAILGVVYRRIE
jgi:hypothetical protein